MGSLPLAQRLSYYANACQQRQALIGFDREPALAFGAMPAELEVASIADLAKMPTPSAASMSRSMQNGARGLSASEGSPTSQRTWQRSSQPFALEPVQQPFSPGACAPAHASDPVSSGNATFTSHFVSQPKSSASILSASPPKAVEAADPGASAVEGRGGDASRLLQWLEEERARVRLASPLGESRPGTLEVGVGVAVAHSLAGPVNAADHRLAPDLRLSRLVQEVSVTSTVTAVDLAKGLNNGRRGAYRLWRK